MNMKRNVVLLLILITMSISAIAQQATPCEVEINKTMMPGFSLTFRETPQKIVDMAWKHLIEQVEGLRGVRSGSFVAYRDQSIDGIGKVHLQLYSKAVEEKSKVSDSKLTVLYVVFLSDNGNAISSETHPTLYTNIESYLNSFPPFLKEYEREYHLALQNKRLETLYKEQQSLNTNREKVVKQLSILDSKIAEKDSIITITIIE